MSALGSNTVSFGSGNLPSISTRRAGTTVELADGQSFAIAGLMQSDQTNAIKQLPILGNIPVLGALFRSTNYQRNETELVVVVTARLVKPTTADRLALPTDVFTPPGDLDQYLLGRLEGSNKERNNEAQATQANAGGARDGGMQASVGHQLNAENSHAK